MPKKKQTDIKELKKTINEQHINFYAKTLSILEFMLDEYSAELTRADIDFLEMPKNAVSTIDFLISAIGKVQKGQRLALGLDDEQAENIEPVINIVEGLCENKI